MSIFFVGCDPPTTPPSPPDAEERAEREADAPTQAATRPAATPRGSLTVTLAGVRTVGEMVEVEVVLSRPLPPTSGRPPSLHVGDEVVTRSRAGEGGRLDRLVFTMPSAQYERMPKDVGMIVRAGLLTNEAEASKPRLAEAP